MITSTNSYLAFTQVLSLTKLYPTMFSVSEIEHWTSNIESMHGMTKAGCIRIATFQPPAVVAQVLSGKIVKPIINPRYRKQYHMLSSLTGFKAHWFGVVVTMLANIYGSDANNSVLLVLDIPQSKIFITDYYAWTDLMYFTELYCDDNLNFHQHLTDEITSEEFSAIKRTIFKPQSTSVSQAVFPEILQEWVVSCKLDIGGGLRKQFDGNGGKHAFLWEYAENLPNYTKGHR